jgi:hypothetical protein
LPLCIHWVSSPKHLPKTPLVRPPCRTRTTLARLPWARRLGPMHAMRCADATGTRHRLPGELARPSCTAKPKHGVPAESPAPPNPSSWVTRYRTRKSRAWLGLARWSGGIDTQQPLLVIPVRVALGQWVHERATSRPARRGPIDVRAGLFYPAVGWCFLVLPVATCLSSTTSREQGTHDHSFKSHAIAAAIARYSLLR